MVAAVPLPQEGRFAVVTDVGSGMRWPPRCARRAQRGGRRNRAVLAPDAGVKPAGDEPGGDGGYKARHTGEITYKP